MHCSRSLALQAKGSSAKAYNKSMHATQQWEGGRAASTEAHGPFLVCLIRACSGWKYRYHGKQLFDSGCAMAERTVRLLLTCEVFFTRSLPCWVC